MNAILKLYIISIVSILFFSFSVIEAGPANRNTIIKNTIQSVQHQYAPDQRTAVFNISYRQVKAEVILCGEVNTLSAKIELFEKLRKSIQGTIVDSIRILPDSTVGTNTHGIVIIDVGNVRRFPRHDGELVTQAQMGTVVTLLKKEDDYYFVQLKDNYLGWMNASSLSLTNQAGVNAWNAASKLIITDLKCIIHSRPELSSVPLCTVVAGCILKSGDKKNGWTKVQCAGGQEGYVLDTCAEDLDTWNKSRRLTRENLEETARKLLDIPYLWGGISVKEMDCSGFIKIVYRFNGMELHRDADQQADQGNNIDPGKEFKNLQKGDLLFFCKQTKKGFSKHISHVALSLGNDLFIHSLGRVRLGSFDPTSAYFEEKLLRRFVRARRIIEK
jgi:gamma-D-glutamyl-L-lysine dipeptidyl-peptidase